MNRTAKLILIIVTALTLMYLAIKPDRVNPEVRQIREINREYPVSKRELNSVRDEDILSNKEFETGFMNTCIGNDADQIEFCTCGFNYIQEEFTNQDIIRYIEYMQAEDPRGLEMLNPAVDACIHLL